MNDQQAAKKWACDERTIRRWRKQGAPLDDGNKMREWLSGRREIPAGTASILTRKRATQKPTRAKPGLPGAANALQRLEQAEEEAHRAFKKAEASGDVVTIAAARKHWLALTEQLRKFDLQIEETKKQSGEEEVLKRKVTVKFARAIAYWVNVAFREIEVTTEQRRIQGLPTDSYEAHLRAFAAAIAAGTRTEPKIPEWLANAFAGTSVLPGKIAHMERAIAEVLDLGLAVYHEAAARKKAEVMRQEKEWLAEIERYRNGGKRQ